MREKDIGNPHLCFASPIWIKQSNKTRIEYGFSN